MLSGGYAWYTKPVVEPLGEAKVRCGNTDSVGQKDGSA